MFKRDDIWIENYGWSTKIDPCDCPFTGEARRNWLRGQWEQSKLTILNDSMQDTTEALYRELIPGVSVV